LIDVSSSAPEAEVLAALSNSVAAHGADADAQTIYAYLGHLLAPQSQDPAIIPVQALDPQTLQARYLEALRQWLTVLAAHHPLMLICDDVHWADPSSVEALTKLIPLLHEQRILLAFITRPDPDAPGWRLVTAARALGETLTEIALNPLSEADSQQLVSNLLNVDALPATTRAAILRKAEGNPFFVEEVLRMLIDRGVIGRQADGGEWRAFAVAVKDAAAVDIPDNLHGLLLARIDRLVDDAKRALRVASVIGRQFSVRVLEQIATLVNHLSTLEASGLIRLAQAQPELEYLFRHALVQEVAYSSLVKQDRRQLHLAVGEALEKLYPDRLASRELAPVLGQHFYLGGDDSRALKYLTWAGDVAAKVYANAEAIAHYTRALEVAKRGPVIAAAFSHLYTSLGNALELSARYAEAMQGYAELETLARSRGDKRMELDAVMARAKVLATPNPAFNPSEGRRALERALELSREIGDRADECRILWNLLVLTIFGGGDMRQAIAHGEQSIALAKELGLRERQAFATQDIYYAYVAIDQPRPAWERLVEARELWRELGVTPMLADNLSNIAIRHYERGELDDAIAAAAESYRLYQSIGNVYGLASSRFAVSGVYIARGDFAAAEAIIAEGIRCAEQGGHMVGRVSLLVDEARRLAGIGATAQAIEAARRAVTAGETHFPLWTPMAHGTLARLLIETGDLTGAAEAVRAGQTGLKPESLVLYGREMVGLAACALALAQGQAEVALTASAALIDQIHHAETFIFLPEALWLKGRAQAMLNDAPAAHATFTEAEALAKKLDARYTLSRIQENLNREERKKY
jgi:tetratricopeptide (TPR) repeat protein